MKTATTAMINLLNSGNNFYMADLYTFTLVNTVGLNVPTDKSYRYTTADIDIAYGGNIFKSVSGDISRNSYKSVKGTEVDTLQVTISPSSDMLVMGGSFASAVFNGAFDGAILKLERAFMPTWGDTSAGTVHLFIGSVSTIQGDRTSLQFDIKSQLELMNIQMPRNIYQAPCTHILYDTGCSLNINSYSVSLSANSGSTNRTIQTSLSQSTYPNGFFEMGVLTATSGVNTGAKRTVKTYSSGVIELSLSLPNAVSAGDTFTIVAGCDKTTATCTNKFNNIANFKGFPYVPIPETAY